MEQGDGVAPPSQEVRAMTRRKKARRVVLGTGYFGFSDLGKSAQLWRQDNGGIKTLNMERLRQLEYNRVRLVAEVLE